MADQAIVGTPKGSREVLQCGLGTVDVHQDDQGTVTIEFAAYPGVDVTYDSFASTNIRIANYPDQLDELQNEIQRKKTICRRYEKIK